MEIGVAITSKVAQYLVEPTINQVRYLFCFNSIVEDLEKEETNLKFAKDNVKKDAEIAERNTEKVKEDVSKWLTDASNVLADVQKLREEIDINESCLIGWCPNWCCKYWLSRKAAEKTSMMLKLQDSGKFSSVAHPTTLLPPSGFLTPSDFELFQSSQSALEQIIEALKNDKVNLVGLHGMGGAGKTTLAKVVGDKVKHENMFDEVVMVVVSQTPNFKNMQGVLADSLGLTLNEETEEGRGMRLYKRFTETNVETKKKILVILDDAWEMFDLKSKIGFPFGEDNKDCKILLTTRKQHLCSVLGCQSQIPLGLLNDDEALTLLKRHAGRIDDDSFTCNDLAIKVAKECKGLPLAIATIGSALKGKGADEWKLVFKKLRNSKLVDIHNVVDVDKDVYAILKFSYDYLKGEEIKFCFLLCSLFPEDSEIPLEELVRYGMGLGLFSDAESIEDARIALRGMVNNLKASFLLLEANDGEHVKMHDMVRDVALWIASQGKGIFMVKAGMGLTEWPNEENLEHCKAISLMNSYIEVLPNRLFCPALEILLVTGTGRRTKVSDQFFEEVRGLKVLNLSYWDLSLKSLQLLTNLKTLELNNCNLRDISYLVKLNKLEILSFQYCSFNELPREVGELGKLRLLYLDPDDELERISSNVIRRCSQLEELYITSFKNWEVKETSTDQTSNASLFELNSLSRLAKLHLRFDATCLPKDFAFRNLERYVICMNTYYRVSYPRALSISKIEAASLSAFRSLYQNLEYFYLNETSGCQNILPSIDQGGLKELKSLELSSCSDLKFIIDTSQQHLPANALSNLVKLSLNDLVLLKDICCRGRLQKGLLEKMETINVSTCPNVCTLFPTELLRGLLKLKEVKIFSCDQLQELFQFQHEGEENDLVLLPSLSKLNLESLPKLSYIWKGPTNNVNLKTLTYLRIVSCKILEHLFPVAIAQGLVVLEELIIEEVPQLKQVFHMGQESEEIEVERDGKGIVLPKLRKLTLGRLASLTSFLPQHYHSTCISLEKLKIFGCSNLTASFISEIKIQDLNEKLRVLHIKDCHHELCDGLMLTCLRHGFKNLEELGIEDCAIKVVFPLEGLAIAIDGQHELLFPNLKKLSIEDCGELEQIIVEEDHMQPLSFSNLSRISVKRCNKLKHLFSITIAQSLQKLQYISLEDCGELEQIIVKEDHMQPLSFPNLLGINVERCNKLKHLFPITIPNSFQKLQDFNLEDCGELEQIIVEEDHMQPLSFPNLSGISVRRCNKLKHVFPISIAQSLQKLQDISLEDCGELEQIIVEQDHMQPLSFPNLSRINVLRCNKLKHLFPITIAQSLQKLQDIKLEDCGELEQIIVEEDHMQPLSLPNLSRINVERCNKLKHLFPITIAQSLQKLLDINLEDCGELEQIIVEEDHMQPLSFPNLLRINVKRCNKLKHLFPITIAQSLQKLQDINLEDYGELEQIIVEEDHMQPLPFPNLSRIKVKRCNKLKYLFPVTMAQSLQKLQDINLVDNSQSEVIYGPKDVADVMDDKEIVLPQLEELSLKALPSFSNICPSGYNLILKLHSLYIEDFQEDDLIWDGIFTHLRDVKNLYIKDCAVKELKGSWKDPTYILSLQNLTCLDFYNCHQLRHIFSSTSVAQNLSKLKELNVWDCGELEKIIVEEDDIQPLLFPNLRYIDVRRCKKLKRVFHISIARGLQQLKRLHLEENIELEEVFGGRDVGKVMEMDDKAITLPRLQTLELEKLPRLSNFCPVGYHFIFPSLKEGELVVRECGKIATRFWLDENESVHAEAKPPKEGAKDDKDAQLPPHHPPLHIYWDWSEGLDSLRAQLPPYEEKINEEQGITPSSRRE